MRKFMTSSASHKIFFAIVAAIIFVLLFFYFFPSVPETSVPRKETISFPARNVSVAAEIADTAEKRAQGLSVRESLPTGSGMWFVFSEEGRHGFWMKDMHFAIDIIWLNERLQIVDTWRNASPDSYPKIVVPKVPAKYVLEVPAGFVARHDLAEGDTAEVEKTP